MPNIYGGDLPAIVMNDITIKLYAVSVLPGKQHLVAYLYILKLDLFDPVNTQSVTAFVFDGNESVEAAFSTGNIGFIYDFSMENIFAEMEVVPEVGKELWDLLAAGLSLPIR